MKIAVLPIGINPQVKGAEFEMMNVLEFSNGNINIKDLIVKLFDKLPNIGVEEFSRKVGEQDENQLELLTEQYIQYQLFSMAELDSYVEDKKRFIDDLIKDIKEDYLKMGANDLEENKHKRRIYVF